jgi:Large polyvalent protein-associated domain 1
MPGLFDDIVNGTTPAAPTQAAPTPSGPGPFDDLPMPPAPATATPTAASPFADLPMPPAPAAATPTAASPFADLPMPPTPPSGELTQGPGPSLGERFMTAAGAGFNGTLLGGAVNALTSGFYSGVQNPIDPNTGQPLPGPTPEQQAVTAEQAPGVAYANEPAATGVLGQAASVLGTLAGGAASPESLVAGPEGYEAVRGSEAVLPTVLKSAGVQAAVQGGANAAAQGANIAAGEQTGGFDPGQVAESAGTGALIGAAAPAAGAVVNALRGTLDDVHVPAAGDTAPEPASTPAAAPVAPTTGVFDDLPLPPTPSAAKLPEPAPPTAGNAEPSAATATPPAASPPEPAASPIAEQAGASTAAVQEPQAGATAPLSQDVQAPASVAPEVIPVVSAQPEPALLDAAAETRSPSVELSPETTSVAADNTSASAAPAPTETQTEPADGASVPETSAAPTAPPVEEPRPVMPPADNGAAPLADMSARGGATPTPSGTSRPGQDFNEETSPYRQVFRDAGHDPDQMVSRPLAVQNRVIGDQLKSAFGFKSVEIDPRQQGKEVRDQLSNFYHNGREMAAALGMPEKAIGLDGRVSFTTKPYRSPKQALGSYAPGSRTITIPGRSNSFAHEYTHALDHYLSDALAGNPKAMKLLSRTAGLADGRVGGKVAPPGSPAEAFVNVMRAIYGGDAPTAAEALKLQYAARGEDPKAAFMAELRLKEIESQFAKGGKEFDAGRRAYWANPAELLARAHEAYVADKIERAGGDTRAVAKGNYETETPGDTFEKLYPQLGERDYIFQAFTDLHDALRRESLLGKGAPATRPDGLDIVDPHVWDKMADPKQEPGLWGVMKREVQAQKNLRAQFKENLGFNDNAADPGRLGIGTRTADVARALTYSLRGIGNVLTKRQPEGPARDAFQHIMDQISPAEHIRSAESARGRYIGPVFEEEVREHARSNNNRMANILTQNGLGKMSAQDKLMLRHVLTEGDAASFVPDGASRPVAVPANITKAAGALRYLLDQEWERNTKAGLNVGYARSGYFPRQYDDRRIFDDRLGFEKAATELHSGMFDTDVGADPEKLLAAHDRLPGDVTAGFSPEVQVGVKALRKNLREQDQLQAGMSRDADPAASQTRINELQTQASSLHDALHDPLRNLYARTAAAEWWHRINTGDPTDFDTRGPSSAYATARVLPPEADRVLRGYMVTDPTVAIPRYFQSSARRVAFANRFGASGSKLDALLGQATQGGARGEDIATMRRLVQAATGRVKSGLPPEVERATNTIHALGSIALMGRAAWSSLSEPMAMLARTASVKATGQVFANQLGDIVRSASSKQRAELANALGITISSLHDSVISDRTDAHYDDAPGLNKLMGRFYSLSGLTGLTNSQRRSVMGAGHTALDAWSRDLLGGNARLSRDAAAQFRDLGVPDAKHTELANWVTQQAGLPTPKQLDTPGGRLWGQAISRLTDKVIQDPLKVDKPLMSQNPVGRLAYGLQSFNYAFYHNVVEHALDLHTARVKEGYADAKAAGAGAVGALKGTVAPLARAGVHVGASAAAIYAGAYLSSALREALLNHEEFEKHEQAGDLHDWLSDLAFQRTGFNGPMDPVAQAITGLKYNRDLSGLMSGAQAGWFLQAAGNLLAPLSGAGSPDTNTSRYAAVTGAWNMFGVPAAGAALSALPGGPLTRAGYSAAMQYLTSGSGADAVATALAGAKGSKNDGTPPPGQDTVPGLETDPATPPSGTGTSSNAGTVGGIPVGLLDDFLAPGVKVGLPLFTRLPRVGKIGVGLAAGAAGVSALAHALSFQAPNDGD